MFLMILFTVMDIFLTGISFTCSEIDEWMAIPSSIEEFEMEWRLDDKIKKWIQVVGVVVPGLLSSEKYLCKQIFAGCDKKGYMMQLLNFGEAAATSRRTPAEKLFKMIDMYDALDEVLPGLKALLIMYDDAGDRMVRSEAKVLMDRLGEAVIATLVELENAIQGEASRKNPLQNGCRIHPLARYAMNYANLLVEEYSDTLSTLAEVENTDNADQGTMSFIAGLILQLIASLESSIEAKSKMFEDSAKQFIFLMNNIFYIVQKVEDSSGLQNLLGDKWIRKRRGLVQQYATQYLRASWSKVLSCLKDEGIWGSSGNGLKALLKERFKNFNACFEDVYRIQTGWRITDDQLREELRISISQKVIPAYRSFKGRYESNLESERNAGKCIKYTADELEQYLLDLFEGIPLILNPVRRMYW